MNILQVKKYCLLIKDVKEQAKFAYSPFGKSIEKQTKNRLPLQSPYTFLIK